MTKTKIEWADEVWNPMVGCTKLSIGCQNCYAERMFNRFHRWPVYPAHEKFSDVRCYPERLDQPLHWKKPRRVFVDSMSDLFHEDVPSLFIYKIFDVIASTPKHIYLILTKRPERMCDFVNRIRYIETEELTHLISPSCSYSPYKINDPISIPNLWLGVSVENQATADYRIPLLLQTPAAVRFVSVEPMLEEINLLQINASDKDECCILFPLAGEFTCDGRNEPLPIRGGGIRWVICGCESGPDARSMKMSWAAYLKHQCVFAGVPFFLKQAMIDGKLAKMPELDGKIWDEIPT